MDILSLQFLSALLAIIVIDLVLAGDNAIVIALAARNVPRDLQKRAILWGAVGAIVVRTSMTLVVVWLLKIPGLLFVGGCLLVFIAYRLLIPDDPEEGAAKPNAAQSFWGALRTIVIADAIMGLDNVLAVAGAAHGSFLLVVLGLLVSIPIVIWGSTLILGVVERYPAFVYFGAGVLAWTAVKMMTTEPRLTEYFTVHRAIIPVLYFLVVAGVLWVGFVRNHHTLESRIHARLASSARQRAAEGTTAAPDMKGETTMQKVLVPVDGSRNALNAVRHVIDAFAEKPDFEVHVLNVQPPFSRHIARFVSKNDRDSYHRDQAEQVLAPIRKMLDDFRVPCATHTRLGHKAEMIAEEARRLRCDRIVLGTARKNSLTRMVEASVTNRVLDLTSVPVEIVVGDSVSKLERYGIPAGIGAGIGALLFLAAD